MPEVPSSALYTSVKEDDLCTVHGGETWRPRPTVAPGPWFIHSHQGCRVQFFEGEKNKKAKTEKAKDSCFIQRELF